MRQREGERKMNSYMSLSSVAFGCLRKIKQTTERKSLVVWCLTSRHNNNEILEFSGSVVVSVVAVAVLPNGFTIVALCWGYVF